MQKWHVILDNTERKKIKMVLRSKKFSIETKKRAQILQDLDESRERKVESVNEIARKRGVSQNTVIYTRKKNAKKVIDEEIFRKRRETPHVTPKVTGEVEAHIIACACSTPPNGFTRWSMQMIADKVVLNGVVESISEETVRLVLKNTT